MNSELENFIIEFQEEENPYVQASILHSFIQSYLHTSKDDKKLKEAMFLRLISKMPELFAELTNSKNAACTPQPMACINDKQLQTSNLQGAELCLEILLVCFKNSETSEQLPLLFRTAINILGQSYTHCKESEALYGNLLEDFSDLLGNFLNKILVVQTALLSGFDGSTTLELNDSELSALVTISEDLGNLCNLVSSLDATLSVKLWRNFIKIIMKYPEQSRETIAVDPIISSLISKILEIVDEYKFKMENEELVEESDIKIFLFFTNLVMKLFHVFHSCLKESFQSILLLAVKLTDLLIISYSPMVSDKTTLSPLQVAVRNTVKPIIDLFYCDSSFLDAFLQLDSKELSPDLHIAHILLKSSALDCLLSTKADHMKSLKYEDIFKKAMNVLQSNNIQEDIQLTSIRIPNSMFQYSESLGEDNDKPVTIYQYVYIRYSKYSRKVSENGFIEIENRMLELLVTCSELVSLLISDIWIYRLRCSSTEYLHARIINLLQSFSRFQSNFRYKHLLQRMIKFLPFDNLIKLFEDHGEVKHFVQRPNRVLHRYCLPELTGFQIERGNFKILKMISLLMNELKSPSLESAQLITKACCLLELFSFFVNISENSEIIKFTELAKYFFKSEIYEVQIAVLTYLKAFNVKIFCESDIDFKKVVNVLATLLADTLQCRNYIVKFEAFHTYASLAQCPALGKICRQTVVIAPTLASSIKSYFSKVPLNGFLSEKERMKIQQKLPHCPPEIAVEDIKKLLPLKTI